MGVSVSHKLQERARVGRLSVWPWLLRSWVRRTCGLRRSRPTRWSGRGTAVMFVTMKPTRGRRDGHGHRRTVRLHHARRHSTAPTRVGPEPLKALSVDVGGTRTL